MSHARRLRGRQAEAERNDRLVLDAAREVFAERGAAAPVSEVAARAGVGMGSLYRRYGSKTELLQRLCMLAMEQNIEAAEAGLATPDAWNGLVEYVSACVAQRSGALAPLAGTIPVTQAMIETSRRSRELLGALVARAHGERALRADVTALDIAWLIELFGGRAPASRGSGEGARRGSGVRASRGCDDGNIIARLLAIALDGLRAPGTRPLPGTPPASDHYEKRWQAPPAHGQLRS
jgi:AcrR family transcriptional regulator